MSGSSPAKHIRTLQRRVDWLKKRVTTTPKDLSFDKGEIAALEWAILNLQHLKTNETSI